MKHNSSAFPFWRNSLIAITPILWWAAHFFFCYVFAALACDARLDQQTFFGLSVFKWVLAAASFIAIGAIAHRLHRASRAEYVSHAGRRHQTLFTRVSVLGAALALIGVIWGTVPLMAMPACHFTCMPRAYLQVS